MEAPAAEGRPLAPGRAELVVEAPPPLPFEAGAPPVEGLFRLDAEGLEKKESDILNERERERRREGGSGG